MRSRSTQHILGFILAAYGFFLGVYPEKFRLPFIPNLTMSQSNVAAAVLLLIGGFLLFTNRQIIKL